MALKRLSYKSIMKKVLLFILLAVALLFISDRIYQYYSGSHVNSHEAIILINNLLDDADVDSFFGLRSGTYDAQKHKVVFSLVKKEGSVLGYYINLPAKKVSYLTDAGGFNCDNEYPTVSHYRFYDYEVGDKTIIARVIRKTSSSAMQQFANEIIAKRDIHMNYQFGQINVIDVGLNGIEDHCH